MRRLPSQLLKSSLFAALMFPGVLSLAEKPFAVSGPDPKSDGRDGVTASPAAVSSPSYDGPFSKVAIGPSISPLGIGLDVTTNLNRHLNFRASGSFLDQPIHFSTNGFHADAEIRFASSRASLDVYPFHNGFRLSPGLLFYNQNRITGSETLAAGTSFTLNGDTFFSPSANTSTGAVPTYGSELINLHATRPAFTITAGWGNPLGRSGHWSFPFEAGIALSGGPAVNVNLGGWACRDIEQTQCANISNPASNSLAAQVQTDLQAELAKWKSDLDPLKTFPIIKGGVTYSFRTRRR